MTPARSHGCVLAALLCASLAAGCGASGAPVDTTVAERADTRASTAECWNRLRDLRAAAHYVPGVVRVELTGERREGIGASRRVLREDGDSIDESVIEWRDGEGFSLRLHREEDGPPPPFERAEFRYALVPRGAGSRVTTELRYTLRWGALGRLLDRLAIEGVVREQVRGVAAGLARYCDEGPAALH